MGAPTLTVTEKRTSIEMRQGLSLAVTERPTVLAVTLGGQTLQLPIRRTSIEIREPMALEVPLRRTSIEFSSQGVQGASAPSQIIVGGAEPAPIVGYPLLYLEPAGTGDPDDYLPSVIVEN